MNMAMRTFPFKGVSLLGCRKNYGGPMMINDGSYEDEEIGDTVRVFKCFVIASIS